MVKKSEMSMECDDGPQAPAVLLVLVHGTFAPRAAWTQQESRLRSSLIDALATHGPVRFCTFMWPGSFRYRLNNSHRIRLAAGLQLRKCLRSLAASSPGVPIFLVTHSHGGNVAFYALRGTDLHDEVLGVATIGCPFLIYRDRPVVDFMLAVLSAVVYCPLLVASIVVVGEISDSLLNLWVMLPLLAVECLLLVWIAGKLRIEARLRWWIKRLRQPHRSVATPELREIPKFIAYSPYDEAAAWLNIGVVLSRAPARLGGILARIAYFTALLGGSFLLIPAFLLFPIQVLLARTTRALPFFFGGETFLMNTLGDISVVRSAPSFGANPLDQLHEYRSTSWIAHSLYKNSSFQRDLGAWISRVLSTSSERGAN